MDNLETKPDEYQYKAQLEALFERVLSLLESHQIYPDAVQQKMLHTHLKAMVERSHSGESLPEIETEMFDEISELSHQLAKDVVSWVGQLAFEETYLLSVHFEVAKENEQTQALGESL